MIVEPELRRAVFKLLELHLGKNPDDISNPVVLNCISVLVQREMDRPKVDALLAPYKEILSLS